MSVRDADKTKPYIPLASGATDGFSEEGKASATCFCGQVQLSLPTEKPGLIFSALCHCTDCRKLTASMFSSLVTVDDQHLQHVRGEDKLTQFTTSTTPASGRAMTNYFCSVCGTLMYRKSEDRPTWSICRLGTIDDFNLAETKLRPTMEIYTKDRCAWLLALEGAVQSEASPGRLSRM